MTTFISEKVEEFEDKFVQRANEDDVFINVANEEELESIITFLTSAMTTHGENEYRRGVEEATKSDVRYREIAELISSIFFYGGFKSETYNERELEKLLREVNLWPTNEDIIVKRSEAHSLTNNL